MINLKVSPLTMRVIVAITRSICKKTGYLWRFSSHVYDSYSHRTGHSWDIVPDIAPSSMKFYAHNVKSDPVLHNRLLLLKKLLRVAHSTRNRLLIKKYSPNVVLIIAVENNHLHCGLYRTNRSEYKYPNNIRVWKWQETDPERYKYEDTSERQKIYFK